MIDTPLHTGNAASQTAASALPGGNRGKRRGIILLATALFIFGAGILGFRIAVQAIKDRVVKALGPGSEITDLKVGWSSVELIGLDIPGRGGWPAMRMFRADRVKIVPSVRSLLTDRVEISSITVENPYLSVLRVPGKLLIVPSLLEAGRGDVNDRNGGGRSSLAVAISTIVLQNGTMEIFDATVAQPPLKIWLEKIEAVVHDLSPANSHNRIRFELAARAKGKTRDGGVKVSGWVEADGRDSSSHVVLDGVDLVSLQPYIAGKGDARIGNGTLDLNLRSEVRDKRLEGSGKMIIRNLEFAPSRNYLGTFMGLPRSAVISFLKDHNNAINLNFTLSGDVRHPDFSLNETLATRVATGMAEQLGVSIQGVAEGMEALGRKGMEGARGTVDAIGSVFKGLFSAGESP